MAHPAHATVVDLYDRHAETWARLRDERLIEARWLERFCALLPPGPLLDIGCGSGVPLARELARRGHLVTGVDAAPAMLALFRHNLPAAPAHLADMRQLDLGQRFAGLLAWDSLFHLTIADQRAMFARLAAHALPGAMLMFTSGPAEGEAIGRFAGAPLYHASLGADDYRGHLARAGFATVAHRAEDPECGGRTVWLARQQD